MENKKINYPLSYASVEFDELIFKTCIMITWSYGRPIIISNQNTLKNILDKIDKYFSELFVIDNSLKDGEFLTSTIDSNNKIICKYTVL